MSTQPRLVNKQFNSPIGLYSQQNVQEVLERESQILANGAVGINFYNPDTSAPANLKNSAVLRMLQEEENRQRNGIGPGSDHVARPLRENITWPPPEYEHKNSARSTFKDVVVPGAKRVAWPPPNESGAESPYVEQNAVSAQGGPQYPSQSPGFQQNNYQAPAQQSVSSNPPSNRPLKPLDVSTGGSSPLSSPLLNQSPQGFRSSTPIKGWAPVQSPVASPAGQPSWPQSTPRYQQSSTHFQAAHQSVSQQTYLGQQYHGTPQQYQPPQQQYKPPQQQYQQPQQQYQSPQQYQPPQQQYQPPQQQYQPPQQQYQPPQQQYQSPQQQYQPPQQQYQPPQQQYQPPQQQYQSPHQYQPPQQQYQPPQQQYQPAQQQYQPPQQQYQASSQQPQSPQPTQFSPKPAAAPSQAAPRAPSAATGKQVEPPPSTITLRPQAPVRQAPPPIVTSQPATATLKVKVGHKHLRGDQKWPPEDVRKKIEEENVVNNESFLSIQGGKHLRGDLKWPPENVKRKVEEENRLLLELAKGPAVRPKRPNKDYTEFFEQNALNSMYPGYKIPPGTQFYRPL